MGKAAPLISASEVGQFVYCRRAWWLARVCGCRPANADELAVGHDLHRRHGRAAQFARRLRLAAYVLIAGALVTALLLAAALLRAGAG